MQYAGVFAPLVGALVFKTSGRIEKMRQWVRFPYTPAILSSCRDYGPDQGRPHADFAGLH